MNVLTDTFRGLVSRRLWPVAVLLIAALAAVPMLLSKDPAPAPVAPAAPVTGAAAPAAQTALVAAGNDAQSGHRRYVLGAKKDPFAPAPLPKVKHHKTKAATASATPAPSAGSDSSTGSGSSTGVPPVSSVPAPAPAARSYPANSLTVHFGQTSGELTTRTLQTEHALPSAYHPALVYMGLENGGRTAVFMVGADVTKLEGDGRCDPDPASCDTLRLKAGETEFVTVGKTQYELDVDKIHASKSSSAKAATARAARRAKRPKVHF